MKNHRAALFFLALLVLVTTSCRSRTDRSEGTVLLSISNFNGLPSSISLRAQQPPFTIDSLTLRNIPKNPAGGQSELQSIELRAIEVRFVRRDTGTRVPPPNVQSTFGLVPVNGSSTQINFPFLTSDQVLSQPLKDLRDLGRDSETGTAVIVLDASIRAFGRTLSGDDIVSDPARFTIEVRP
ncbi:MAG TPA: hypothetical protein VKK31_05980 [Thermoanaerobaculia bacterium]|nr:hypothetical protein [Thermoanaerobaculia bacterium]